VGAIHRPSAWRCFDRLEGLMRERGIQSVLADASSNAREFYLRRGYRANGPEKSNEARPMTKQL
jgi:putative acetyltransferase